MMIYHILESIWNCQNQKLRLPFCAVLSLFLIAGCSSSAEPAGAPGAAPEPSTDAVPAEVKIQYGNLEQVQKFIAEQKGKIVVLDAWSTYCLPCLREFPELVQLQKKYPQEVVCVSLNLNFEGIEGETPQDAEQEILTFLEEQEAHLVNFVSSEDSETVYKKLNLVSLPAVYVYDSKGKLSHVFENSTISASDEEFSYEKDVVPHVQELLQGKSES